MDSGTAYARRYDKTCSKRKKKKSKAEKVDPFVTILESRLGMIGAPLDKAL
jgi:hypothetical protein